MRTRLQTLALSALLLVPASVAQAQISIGIRIGEPPPPRAYVVPRQASPDTEDLPIFTIHTYRNALYVTGTLGGIRNGFALFGLFVINPDESSVFDSGVFPFAWNGVSPVKLNACG